MDVLQSASTADLSKQLATAVSMVVESMVGAPATHAETVETLQKIPGEVLVFITISAANSTGMVTLHCDMPLLNAIYTAMFGEAPKAESQDDVFDAMGELANVIVGNLKNSLSGSSKESVRMSVPTIVVGRQIPIHPSPSSRWFAGKFLIQDLPLYGSMLITQNPS